MTVATDNASLYSSQIAALIAGRFGGQFDSVCAGEVYGEHLAALGSSELLENLVFEGLKESGVSG